MGIPTYFDIIPRKNARDLRTIRQKLDGDKYESIEAFEDDIDLMIRNAIEFNTAESEVGHIAVLVQDKIHQAIAQWKTGAAKKRKDGETDSSQPAKKMKLG